MADQDIKTLPVTDFEEKLAEVTSVYEGKKDCTVSDLEDIAKAMLSTLPRLDRDKIRKEMQAMHVPTFQSPTTFDINKGLSIGQGYKDRLSEILSMATRECNLRKRVVDMLIEANNVVSKQSSADKRKGEATMRWPIAMLQLEAAETFVEEVSHILTNIKAATEAISRQGSIIQSQIQLGEYRKKLPADFKNMNDAEEKPDYHSGAPKINLEWDEV
jgi:hypothetical protein